MKDAIDRQPLAPLPAADGRDVTPQISSNLLPRLQAPPSRVGMGVWPRYRLGRHGSEGSCLTEAYHIVCFRGLDRKSTRLNSSHGYISYAVFCLKKKKKIKIV